MQQRISSAKTSEHGSSAPPTRGVLQRKCACGGSAGLAGECEECRKKKMTGSGGTLQRKSLLADAHDGGHEPGEVPPLVYDVLRSPGQPLDAETRAFFEPRFGHDFSSVRVHSDARAAESARSVNALAYTVGHDVAFARGLFEPRTTTGTRLLAHELTHVVQQQNVNHGPVQLSGPSAHDTYEQEAESVASRLLNSDRASPAITCSRLPAPAIQRQANAAASPLGKQETPGATRSNTGTEEIKAEAKKDALRIKNIFQEKSMFFSSNQAEIMSILEAWASKPQDTGGRLAPFDYLIVALRSATFEVGTLVKQLTSPFDQIFHSLSSERVVQFKVWMQTRARVFRDEKAIEMAKFEVSKEDVIEAAQLAAELAGAIATGGGSVLLQIIAWLATTLPSLYQKAKAVVDFVDAIRGIKLEDVKKLISPKGVGDLLVKALFGEVRGLPVPEKEDEGAEQEKEPEGGREEKGLMKVLHLAIRIFKALKRVYARVAAAVNRILSAINISNKPWFSTFSMVYAGVVKAVQVVSNPGAALHEAVAKLKEAVASFFSGIKTKIGETATQIKSYFEIIGQPAKLLHILADKAVEMVLNFIITHPPSALVKLAFKGIEAVAKKSIVELLREKIPFADKIINKIADSDTVKRLLKPLEKPVNSAVGLVDRVAGEAGGVVQGAENRIVSSLGNGEQMVADFAGIKLAGPAGAAEEGAQQPAAAPAPGPAKPEEASAAESFTDFLSVVKSGIHSRVMAIGERLLLEKGKDLGKAALEKGKQAAKGLAEKVTGLLIGPKVEFEVDGETHQLWVEEGASGGDATVFVASSKMTAAEKIEAYSKIVKKLGDAKKKTTGETLVDQLEKMNQKLEPLLKNKPKGSSKKIEELKGKMAVLFRDLLKLTGLKTRSGVLHLPKQKAAHLKTYQWHAQKGNLIHDVSYTREVKAQANKWDAALKPGGPNAIYQEKYNEGIEAGICSFRDPKQLCTRLLRPNWSRDRDPVEMHVDHIIELQLLPSSQQGWADSFANYELLDGDSNELSGKLIAEAVAEERRKHAKEDNDPEWMVAPLKFTEVVAEPGKAGERWLEEEIQQGEHVDAWKEHRGEGIARR